MRPKWPRIAIATGGWHTAAQRIVSLLRIGRTISGSIPPLGIDPGG